MRDHRSESPVHHSDAELTGGLKSKALLAKRAAILILLAVGVVLWGKLSGGYPGRETQLYGLVVALLIAAFPPVNNLIADALDKMRHPSLRARRIANVAVFFIAAGYLYLTASLQSRDFFPKWHDHQMYQLQAQMLAHGRLWMPAHPLAEFFETFYVLVKPVYAPMYFPGAALLYAPGVWLHLPTWLLPLFATAGVSVLLFMIITEIVDAVSAGLAVALLMGLQIYRRLSIWIMSHQVLTLFGLLAVYAWLRWRKNYDWRWAAVMGAALGWAAITRPLDTLFYALPLAAAVLWDLRRLSTKNAATAVGVILAAMVPFISLQLIMNKGVTGSWLRLPISYYTDLEMPGYDAIGKARDPLNAGVRPTSTLLQKQVYFWGFSIPVATQHLGETPWRGILWRLRQTIELTNCGQLLLVLAPLALLRIHHPKYWALLPALPLFPVGYYLVYPILLPHYCISAAPAMILAVILGANTLIQNAGWLRPTLVTALTLGGLALAIGALPELNPNLRDDSMTFPLMRVNYVELPKIVKTPAVVLFRYAPSSSFHEEPVYNIDAPWPDDCPIIRAHDLGAAKNIELLAYYLAFQPNRTFYLVDRKDGRFTELGTAEQLYRRIIAGSATRPAK